MPDPTLDAKRAALHFAGKWRQWAAHSPGIGWRVLRGKDSIWTVDADGVAVRNILRRELCDDDSMRPSIRTRDVEAELRDELHSAADTWDGGRWAGLPDGRVLSLRDGTIRPDPDPDPPDVRISMRLAVAPEPGEPTEWLRILGEAFSGMSDPGAVIAYIRSWLRYSLGADCSDHSLLFLFGPPGSGKSTIADTWAWVCGAYAATIDGMRLAGDSANQHPQWLASLVGKRLVRVGELPDFGRWDTVRINALAAGEVIEAHRMRQDSFRFHSVSKLLITGNHRPRVSPGSGLFRRLRLIECRHVPAVPDLQLPARLRGEGGRILQWALDAPGKVAAVPGEIVGAVERYKADSDPLADWIEAHVSEDDNAHEPTRVLFDSYKRWCGEEGREPVGQMRFSKGLTERYGDTSVVVKIAGKATRCRAGLRLS